VTLGPKLSDRLSPHQAAAVHTAITSLVDDFVDDVARLLDDEDFDDTTMADFLPRKYLPRYTAAFAKRFLICFITAADKLTSPEARRLTCVAEELALAAILDQALVVLALDGGLASGDKAAIEGLAADVFDERDFEFLCDLALDGIGESPAAERVAPAGLEFDEWFSPFRPEDPVHPYIESGHDDAKRGSRP
jgi:hypothetical protein